MSVDSGLSGNVVISKCPWRAVARQSHLPRYWISATCGLATRIYRDTRRQKGATPDMGQRRRQGRLAQAPSVVHRRWSGGFRLRL